MRKALIVQNVRAASPGAPDAVTTLGFLPHVVSSCEGARAALRSAPPDLVLLEASAGSEDDLGALIREVRAANPDASCVVLGPLSGGGACADASGPLADAVLGASLRADELEVVLARRARRRGDSRRDPSDPVEAPFAALSVAMHRVVTALKSVGPRDTTVLLCGESGTGKEVAARFLHDSHPRRRGGPMISVHCGASPESLLESELYGHVKGAFTGADRDRVGKFEQAHGGTIFLDEISTMKPEGQLRLLRVLQERQVTRLGASEARPVDVRVVVASNQDLKALVAEGRFRLDLYYRVSTFPVVLPPLKDRKCDIPLLVDCFARRYAGRFGLASPKRFSTEALAALNAHDWPGNVRELESAVEYAHVLSDGCDLVLREDLPPEIAGAAVPPAGPAPGIMLTEEGLSLRTAVSNLERELILQSLRLAGGNKARAAELLDLKRTTFLEKLNRLEEEDLLPPVQADWSSPRAPDGGAA
ncbi:MAG: sigma-54 dependent transcriptional regulator [Acidobacteriia bacterium]|nr:sigma-54 dependent transcriptional regulator [Terriglobia bacterium]